MGLPGTKRLYNALYNGHFPALLQAGQTSRRSGKFKPSGPEFSPEITPVHQGAGMPVRIVPSPELPS